MQTFGLRRVVILSENGGNFFAQSLRNTFIKNAFEVEFYKLMDTDIKDLRSERKVVFIIADEFNENNLTMLKDVAAYVIANSHRVVLLGGTDEVDFVKRFIPASLIMDIYYKPIDVKAVAEKGDKYLNILDYESKKKTILVVDDNGMMLRTISKWFEDKYNVMVANSAQKAQEAIENTRPNLILLDYEMPGISGTEYLKLLRCQRDTKDIPVIFLTSKDDGEIVKKVVALKPEGYLLKNLPKEVIIGKVDKFFNDYAEKNL